MEPWLKRALDYSDHWLSHQMRTTGQPGCVIAVARQGRDRQGRVRDVWLGGSKLVLENRIKAELKRRYGK